MWLSDASAWMASAEPEPSTTSAYSVFRVKKRARLLLRYISFLKEELRIWRRVGGNWDV